MAEWSTAARIFPLLLAFAATLSTATEQLLGADECHIGYQYRYPPVALTCRPNITVTRLDCWVALPTAPVNTRVEVRWYWRSVSDAAGGSNTAYEVDNSYPFEYVRAECDRSICPTLVNNLTVDVSRLEIKDFGSGLQGDYVCRALVVNETSDVVIQALQPSACARLRLNADQVQHCSITNGAQAWQCANSEPSVGQCPQQLSSAHPVALESSRSTLRSSSIFSRQPQSTNTLLTRNIITTTLHSPPIPFSRMPSVTVYSTLSPSMLSTTVPTPTNSDSRNAQQHVIASYIYAPLSALALLVLVGVGITTVIILRLRHVKEKKLSSLKVLQKDGVYSNVLESSEEKESSGKGTSTLNRNSTIYSKPVWPADGQSSADNFTDHHYATIPGEHERQCDTGAYSYAYQHQVYPQLTTKRPDGKAKRGGVYQELGIGDYLHMYSKPSPLLVGSAPMANSPRVDEKGCQ